MVILQFHIASSAWALCVSPLSGIFRKLKLILFYVTHILGVNMIQFYPQLSNLVLRLISSSLPMNTAS